MENKIEDYLNRVIEYIWKDLYEDAPEQTGCGTYWDGDGKYQKQYDTIMSALVPSQGEAVTMHGKALRRISNAGYRYYNDGDEIEDILFQELDKYLEGSEYVLWESDAPDVWENE